MYLRKAKHNLEQFLETREKTIKERDDLILDVIKKVFYSKEFAEHIENHLRCIVLVSTEVGNNFVDADITNSFSDLTRITTNWLQSEYDNSPHKLYNYYFTALVAEVMIKIACAMVTTEENYSMKFSVQKTAESTLNQILQAINLDVKLTRRDENWGLLNYEIIDF